MADGDGLEVQETRGADWSREMSIFSGVIEIVIEDVIDNVIHGVIHGVLEVKVVALSLVEGRY